MKFAVSNIGWTQGEEPEVAKLLQKYGVKYIEIAPTKVWENPINASEQQIASYLDFWKGYGIEVVAFQSMLFPRPDLRIFESEENRQETLAELKGFIRLAGKMGAGVLVFGSPKNRQIGNLSYDKAEEVATEFFRELGEEAQANNTRFCIEPNAPQYACDFVTTAEQGVRIVKLVDNPGFRLHLDAACMSLAGDDIRRSITNAKQYLSHFHISSPMLDQVEDRTDVDHASAAGALRAIDYQGYVSIEMRPGDPGKNLARVERAVGFAQSVYC